MNTVPVIGGVSPGSAAAGVVPTGRLDGNGNVQADSGNQGVVLLVPATRTAPTLSSVQVNRGGKGVIIYLNVTAASGTGGLTLYLLGIDPASGAAIQIVQLNTAAVTTTGAISYKVYPGLPGSGTNMNGLLSATWQLKVIPGDGSSYTYSVGASVI